LKKRINDKKAEEKKQKQAEERAKKDLEETKEGAPKKKAPLAEEILDPTQYTENRK
jgi:hypothetical protein